MNINCFCVLAFVLLACGWQSHWGGGGASSLLGHATCTSPNVTGATFNSVTGVLVSDLDGNGSTATFGFNESCAWTIVCPSGNVVLALSGSMSGASDQVLTVGTDRSFTGTLGDIEIFTQANSLAVEFTTSGVTQAPSFGLPSGWSAEWHCVAASAGTCASPNSTSTIYTAQSGTLLSDADGYGDAVDYVIGQSCAFDIQCPASLGATYIALYPQVEIQTSHALQVRDSVTSALLLVLSSGTGAREVARLVQSTNITLSWVTTSTSARRSDRGWRVGYACMRDHCSALAVTSGSQLFPVSSPITITSDEDGLGTSSVYTVGESCQWHIDCPVGYQYLRIEYATALRTGYDELVLSNPDTHQTLLSFPVNTGSILSLKSSFVEISDGDSGMATSLALGFTSSEFGSAGSTYAGNQAAGFVWKAQCMPSRCSSPNATGTTTTALSGRLLSDADGVKSVSSITESEICDWTVQCPSGYNFAVTDLWTNFSRKDYLKIKYLDGDEYGVFNSSVWFNSSTTAKLSQPTHSFYWSNGYLYGDTTATKSQSVVFQGWSTVKIEFINEIETGYSSTRTYNYTSGSYDTTVNVYSKVGGYTLDWVCLPDPGCLAAPASGSTIDAVSPGFINLDGGRVDTYGVVGSQCSWEFNDCGDGTRPAVLRTDDSSYTQVSWSTSTITSTNNELVWTSRTRTRTPFGGPSVLLYQCSSASSFSDLCWSQNISSEAHTVSQNESIVLYSSPFSTVSSTSAVISTCSWTFTCSTAGDHLHLNISGYAGSSSSTSGLNVLQLQDGNGALLRPHALTSAYRSHGLAIAPAASTVGATGRVAVQATYNSLVINATCGPSAVCFVPTGTSFNPESWPDKEAVIPSDHDSQNSAYKTTLGAACRYTVECPSSSSVQVRIIGESGVRTIFSFYSLEGVEISNKQVAPFESTDSSQKNYTFSQSDIQLQWRTQNTDPAITDGWEVRVKCVAAVSGPSVPTNDIEICNVQHTTYKLSQVGQQINFTPPSNFGGSSSDGGCVLKLDCSGVSGAHTMVISTQSSYRYRSYGSPIQEIFETTTGRQLYNTSVYSIYDSYDGSLYSNLFVVPIVDDTAAVLRLRRIPITVDLSVFCLKDSSMKPTEDTKWNADVTVAATSSYSSNRLDNHQTDSLMTPFRSYTVATTSSSSSYDGLRQFYRSNIQEFQVLQCYTSNGVYNSTQRDYSTGSSYRVSITNLKGNLAPEASSTDKLSFIDGESGTVTSYSDTSYNSRTSTGITSYAVLVHFRSGNTGPVSKTKGYGYYYGAQCGSFSHGSEVEGSDSSASCGYGRYSYNGYCYYNSSGASSTWSSAGVVVLVISTLLAMMVVE